MPRSRFLDLQRQLCLMRTFGVTYITITAVHVALHPHLYPPPPRARWRNEEFQRSGAKLNDSASFLLNSTQISFIKDDYKWREVSADTATTETCYKNRY